MLKFLTNAQKQIEQTLIRLLLEEHSAQGLTEQILIRLLLKKPSAQGLCCLPDQLCAKIVAYYSKYFYRGLEYQYEEVPGEHDEGKICNLINCKITCRNYHKDCIYGKNMDKITVHTVYAM